LLLILGALLLPLAAASASDIHTNRQSEHHCAVPTLPKPTEDYAETMARLQAAGQWHRNGDADRTPPPNPQVGDSWLWYVWDLGGYPEATLMRATVRGMGDHCYVVVLDTEWNITMDQTDVDRIVEQFDNQSVGDFPDQGIWDLNTGHFGDPPNPLDGLDRIFLFYYGFGISSDGYFWIYDQYPDGSQPFESNECDVVYLSTDNGEPAGDYMIAVAAHEFEHMIHFNQDADEQIWLDEGFGELAMWLYGRPDTISGFNNQPDNSLTSWGAQWADYIQTYLYALYLYEQYGGQMTIWDITHHTANGMPSIETVLNGHGYPVTMEEVYGEWAVANYLDDTTVPEGQYGYDGDTLPPFFAFRTHSAYPVVDSSGGVYNWATDYIRLNNFTHGPTVDFDGYDNRIFRLTLVALDPGLPTLVRHVPLDELNVGSYTFAEAVGYDEVIMVISNVHPASLGYYYYSVSDMPTAVETVPQSTVALQAFPNPFNPRTELLFALDRAAHVRLRVHDVAGRLVAEPVDRHFEAGEQRVAWSADGLPAGQYFARLEVDGQARDGAKLVLVK